MGRADQRLVDVYEVCVMDKRAACGLLAFVGLACCTSEQEAESPRVSIARGSVISDLYTCAPSTPAARGDSEIRPIMLMRSHRPSISFKSVWSASGHWDNLEHAVAHSAFEVSAEEGQNSVLLTWMDHSLQVGGRLRWLNSELEDATIDLRADRFQQGNFPVAGPLVEYRQYRCRRTQTMAASQANIGRLSQ
jgi:hypothetical protein